MFTIKTVHGYALPFQVADMRRIKDFYPNLNLTRQGLQNLIRNFVLIV